MTFVYPLFLWALTAIAVPIIIHLFNFRRYKKIYFTNVKFLKELQEESKSKSRLREILVLIARCLTIACLVLAFSQPVISDQKSTVKNSGARAISIYIDNSFSMENVNRQGPLLAIAKTRARQIINAFGSGDKFQIITNDFEGRHQRFHTRDDAMHVVADIKISSSVRLLGDVITRQSEFLNGSQSSQKKIYVFSDAQRTTFNLPDIKPDTTIKITLLPLTANKVNNVITDTCWFETPLQQKGFIQKLHARIVNKSNSVIEAGSAKLFLNKEQIAISSFSLDAESTAEVVFTFECRTAGFNFGTIKIEDYPITFDDALYFAFNSKMNISVCLVNGSGAAATPFTQMFNNDSLFKLYESTEQTVDYGAFKKSDVLVLNGLSELSSGMISELIKFTNQGGAIVVIPPGSLSPSYNSALPMLKLPLLGSIDSTPVKTDKISYDSDFYTGVFEKIEDRLNLPLVNKHFMINKSSARDFDPILMLQNGDYLFGSSQLNNAVMYLFSAPLEQNATNFTRHALFVPTIYQVCFSGLKAAPLFYQVRTNVVINLKNDQDLRDQPPHLIDLENKTDIIPETRSINNSLFLYTRGQVNEPGFYKITRSGNDLLPAAFNYSRRESDLAAYIGEELEGIIEEKNLNSVSLIADSGEDISKLVIQGAEGKKLWKLFIILALVFIALEVALLRLLK